MPNEMNLIKTTANAHMRREMEAGGKWVCDCEACHGLRSLTGVEKMLDVRPLVREIQALGQQLEEMADGPERRTVLARYLNLHDDLAAVMAK